MNDKDRTRIDRLAFVIDAVPFSNNGGTQSQSVLGLMNYEQDMRAIVPAIKAVLHGMRSEHYRETAGWMPGADYDDPDIMLDAMETWVKDRKAQNWEDANAYSFLRYSESAREKMVSTWED